MLNNCQSIQQFDTIAIYLMSHVLNFPLLSAWSVGLFICTLSLKEDRDHLAVFFSNIKLKYSNVNQPAVTHINEKVRSYKEFCGL